MHHSIRISVAACAALFIGSDLARAGAKDKTGPVLVHWQKKAFAPDALPPELPEHLRGVIREWSPWALQMGYRLDLDPAGRVLMLSSAKRDKVKREMKLVAEALATFDAALPYVDVELTLPASSDVALPARGAGPDETVVLMRLESRAVPSALEFLADRHPYLASWAAASRGTAGFLLEQPLCGAWVEGVSGQEEWRPENELVNRLAQLLLTARFGHQPNWLAQAVAWHVELEVAGDIYAFPGREGFVGIGEHAGWARVLEQRFDEREDRDLELAELAAWPRGTYDEAAAGVAWGLVTFLARHRPEALSHTAADLGAHHAVFGRVTHADGSWERIVGFEVPGDAQKGIVLTHAGDDVFAEASRFFRKGKRYRPGRR